MFEAPIEFDFRVTEKEAEIWSSKIAEEINKN